MRLFLLGVTQDFEGKEKKEEVCGSTGTAKPGIECDFHEQSVYEQQRERRVPPFPA